MWTDVIYEPGEIKVIAYKEGKVLGENSIKTAGKPYQLKLTPDKKTLKANGEDLSYILIEAFDKNGNLCPLANHNIEIDIIGKAHIVGVGNGNPQSFEPFQSNKVKLFYGKAMLIVESEFDSGMVEINAKTKKLQGDSTILTIKELQK